MHPILRQVQNLPPQAQQQVVSLVMTLLKQRSSQPSRYLTQDWAGALRHERSAYTSLSLQQETVDDWASRVSD
ncbi:MAG: DUF2281 domain-containing protein [Cyanobacteria bacterium P01_D01_bin.115]